MKCITVHQQEAVPIERVSFSRKRELRGICSVLCPVLSLCVGSGGKFFSGGSGVRRRKIEPH